MFSGRQLLIPHPEVLVNGSTPTDALPALQQVTVVTDLEAPSMVTLQLNNQALMPGQTRWSDEALFDIGNTIEVVANDQTLIYAEIIGLEPEFEQDSVPTLVVRGYDLRHRLMRGQKIRTFTQIKLKSIVGQVAREANLDSNGPINSPTIDYVVQHNQSDLEFLKKWAYRFGFQVFMEDRTLIVEKPALSGPVARELNLDLFDNLVHFYPRLSSLNQVSEVIVQGWNATKSLLRTNASEIKLMGTKSGIEEAKKAFGKTSLVQLDQVPAHKNEAESMAEGKMNNVGLSYITGEGKCQGNPAVRAGKVINISGVGRRFGGKYYVTSATHIFGPNQSYTTTFKIQKNASY